MIKYELKFKLKGGHWKLFDSYSSLDDPQLKIYFDAVGRSKYNGGVKVIEVKTTRKEIEFK